MFKSILTFLASLGKTNTAHTHQPVNQTPALDGLAHLFFNDQENPILGQQNLDATKLDFSINSLNHVNEYLEKVRLDKNLGANWTVIVLRAGAYVGEVIRLTDKKIFWIWVNYEDAVKIDPQIETFGKSIATAALLYDGEKGFLLPLAKVEKYLINGKEDNVQLYAQVVLGE